MTARRLRGDCWSAIEFWAAPVHSQNESGELPYFRVLLQAESIDELRCQRALENPDCNFSDRCVFLGCQQESEFIVR